MADAPQNPPVSFLDNPHAPDLFADVAYGIAYGNGVVKLTFTSHRVNHGASPGAASQVVIGRLVMPISGAQGLRNLLNDYLAKVEAGSNPPHGATIQ